MDILAPHREKWREVPGGDDASPRFFSTDMLAMPDAEFLAMWETNAAKRIAGSLSWLGPLYRDFLAGRRVLELGSGLGFDGLRFAAQGAAWTCADIAPDNLKVIKRVASLKELTINTFLINEDLSFDSLDGQYDVIWASGSMHHAPFEIARQECLSALRHLKPGGRWIELAYPKERWIREGSPSFDQWGKLTDGERTPWAEWYDAEKLRARLGPAAFATVLDFGFSNDDFHWFDFIYSPDISLRPLFPPKPTFGQRLRAARTALSDWSYIQRINVRSENAPTNAADNEWLPDGFFAMPRLQEGATVREQPPTMSADNPSFANVTIDTTTVPYAYSLIWTADTAALQRGAKGDSILADISVEVGEGQLGILWVDEEYQPLEASEHIVLPKPYQQHVLITAPAAHARHLVFRNCAREGLATSFVLRRLRGKITTA